MVRNFSADFDSGAQLFLSAMGIRDKQKQQEMMDRLHQMQIQQMEYKMKLGQTSVGQLLKPEIGEVPAPTYDYDEMQSQLGPQGKITQPTGGWSPNITPETTYDMAKEMMGLKELISPKSDLKSFDPAHDVYSGGTLIRPGMPQEKGADFDLITDPKTGKVYRVRKTGPVGEVPGVMGKTETEKSIPSAGNAVDLAIKRKFGSDYLMNPEKSRQADSWLATPEGRQYTQQARDDLTPPGITFLQTDQGFVPVTTKGAGIGNVGQPTGLGKAIPPAAAEKIGGIEGLLNDIESIKILYKFGTKEENQHWTGPVSGRYGTIQEKYLGTATDKQVQFYSYVRDMQDALLRARSGAQINEQEFKRLVGFLPDVNVPAQTFKSRLIRFENELNNVLSTKKKALQEGGYGSQKENVIPLVKTRKSAFDQIKNTSPEFTDAQINEYLNLKGYK